MNQKLRLHLRDHEGEGPEEAVGLEGGEAAGLTGAEEEMQVEEAEENAMDDSMVAELSRRMVAAEPMQTRKSVLPLS